MRLKLMTPERTLFEGEVTSVAGTAPAGEFEILENHGAWVSSLETGPLRVRLVGADPGERLFAVHGGLIEADPGSVLVLADVAEAADEVDVERAEGALGRARDRIEKLRIEEGTDADRARRAVARATVRLEVSAAGR